MHVSLTAILPGDPVLASSSFTLPLRTSSLTPSQKPSQTGEANNSKDDSGKFFTLAFQLSWLTYEWPNLDMCGVTAKVSITLTCNLPRLLYIQPVSEISDNYLTKINH